MTDGPVSGAGFRYRQSVPETGQCVMDFRYRVWAVPVADNKHSVITGLIVEHSNT